MAPRQWQRERSYKAAQSACVVPDDCVVGCGRTEFGSWFVGGKADSKLRTQDVHLVNSVEQPEHDSDCYTLTLRLPVEHISW